MGANNSSPNDNADTSASGQSQREINRSDQERPEDIRKAELDDEIASLFANSHQTQNERLRVEKKTLEKNELPSRRGPWEEVSFESNQLILQLNKDAVRYQKGHRRCFNQKSDPWRVYGAVIVVHHLGGHVVSQQGASTEVAAGSEPPQPPAVAALRSVEDYLPFPVLLAAPTEGAGEDNSC